MAGTSRTDLIKITAAWLKDNGYTGLFHADNCCGCGLADLMPCGEPSPNCEPGYEGEGECECGGGCIEGIWREKPKPNHGVTRMFDYLPEGRWWDVGLQLVEGCTKVSPGCDNCWSLTAANMRRFNPNPKMAARYKGTVKRALIPGRMMQPEWTGQVNPQWQDLDKIGRSRKPQVYTFWNDLFHPGVEEEFVTSVMGRILTRPQHFYIICTKRPERALAYFNLCYPDFCTFSEGFPDFSPGFKRLMLMTTAENQEMADRRIPILLQIPGVLHGVSVEPGLSVVDLDPAWLGGYPESEEWARTGPKLPRLDWVIAGPETGPRRRPTDIAWFNSLLSQCKAAGVPYFQKALEINSKISKNMDEWPSYIRVREVPVL